jgi:EmrB/QacA subfamily drug resistance transporter
MGKMLQFPHPYFKSRPTWKWFILINVLIGATMSALDVSIVNVAMPTLKTDFNTSMATIEWVAMAYMLTLTVMLPFFGRLADMVGRSKLYNTGFVIFTIGSVFCGMATSASFIIAARVLQAVGAGLLQANSVALITQAFPSNELGKAIGIQGAVQAIAMAVGPFVGGLLIASVGWRAVFYINVPIGILGTLAGLFILPRQEQSGKREKIDYLGTVLFATGLAALVLAFNNVGKLGWSSPVVIACFIAAFVLLPAFVFTELKVKSPMMDLKLFKNWTFTTGNLTGMLSYYVMFAVLFLMPFYFENVLGYSPALTGTLLTPIPLAMAFVAPVSGHVSDKYGPRIMTSAGMLAASIACFAFMFLRSSASLPILIGELVLLGIGMGLFTPPNNSAIMCAAPKEKLGLAGGLLNMMRSLGLIFGVDISGLIFSNMEHQSLALHGFANAKHVFSNVSIPLAVKDSAFMHGFMFVMGTLLLLTGVSTVLSVMRKSVPMDAEAMEAAKQLVGE